MGLLTLGRSKHTDPAKPFHLRENRNNSKDPSSGRQREGNCTTWGKVKKDVKQKKTRPKEEEEGEDLVGDLSLARRGPGWRRKEETRSVPPEQRGSTAPHPPAPKATLVGSRDTCPFYNFSLFTTSMKFLKINTRRSGDGAKAVSSVDARPAHTTGCCSPPEGQPHRVFLLSPAKRMSAKGPQAPRRSNRGFHMCTDLCLKKKACTCLRS